MSTLRSLFRDGAFRYGIKFGLSGVLAVFLALVIKLQMPTWALFTVFVLMIAQYVGAIAEKSFFRFIGTAVGGVLGYLVTGAFEQNPLLFLLLVGLIVGFCVAMFGQSRYPYAFLLCGMTTVVVASNGMANPDNAWQFMLWRTEEVSIGIIATLLVQSLLWPRFARVEFIENTRAAFTDLQACFLSSSRIFLDGPNPDATRQAEGFPARISALRGLLDFGARESLFFRERLGTYFEITSTLGRVAAAIVTLEEALPSDSIYREVITDRTDAVHNAIAAGLGDLGKAEGSMATRRAVREEMDRAFHAIEEHLVTLRADPRILSIPPEQFLTLGLHILALDEIRQQIARAHELLDSLPDDPGERSRDPEPFVPPVPPLFWIRTGIKSATALIIALVIFNWADPPGGSMFVLGAWVFTTLNATSPGGRGDRRAFHFAIYLILITLGLSLVLLLARPLLSSYAVMNIVIFTWLFVWGHLSYTTRGVTMPMQAGMLMIVGILGLNGQEPISFQAIVGYFLSLSMAVLVASFVQRLMWPSLPQWELRDRFLEFLRTCRRAIELGPKGLPLWEKTRIALIPGEATVRINLLHPPICPAGEPAHLQEYLNTLRRIGSHLLVTIGRLTPLLPESHAEEGKKQIAGLEAELERHLAAHEAGMEEAAPFGGNSSELSARLDRWKQWVAELRAWMYRNDYPSLEVIRIIGLSGRYAEAGHDLLRANEQASRLRLALYMGDYVL